MRDDTTIPLEAGNSGRSPEALRRQFEEQRSYLDLVCSKYDEGDAWYAKHIASAIYVFVHDNGKKNKSLLTQMGLKHAICYVNTTAFVHKDNLFMDIPLVAMKIGSEESGYVPHFSAHASVPVFKNSFRGWWEQIVIKHTDKFTLSREKLIRCFRDNEGGGHFDEQIRDSGFKALAEDPSVGFVFTINGQVVPIDGPHYATVRHIGWEFQQTLAAIAP